MYDPSTGGSGINKLVAVEKFVGLSLNSADPNYVVTRINGSSELVEVPASYVPPGAPPAGFPLTPTMLSNTLPTNLEDLTSAAYLTLQPTDPTKWPILFGVTAQPSINPVFFDLDVVYSPSTGAVGVTLPINLETFTNLSLETAASVVNGDSNLVAIESFASTADSSLSAHALMTFDPAKALPAITLSGVLPPATETWEPAQDLLEAGESDLMFVVEVESDGTATLRFGDNTNGRMPETGTHFLATYRVGNGTAGNVGPDSLTFFAGDPRIQKCRNPLPAAGGIDPETNDQIRRRAPQAFMTQERAVTMADYAAVAEQNIQVDQAVANLRWTGSWYTVFLAVEPQGAGSLTTTLQRAVKNNVERYHLAGQDLEVDNPQYVPLQVKLEICVDTSYFRSNVEQSLLHVLGSSISSTGQKGLFYPDNFTFGQTVYLSPIYAAARSVAGVVAVRASTFQPQGGIPTTTYIDAGEIPIGPLQIARLANDRSFPNHGQLSLTLEGGK